jgi:CRISPR/Cas system CSM-associated protein Csm2 small subunit
VRRDRHPADPELEAGMSLKMFDAHEEARKAALREMYEYVDSHEERLEHAKELLGDKYLLSPNYNGHYVPVLSKKVTQ